MRASFSRPMLAALLASISVLSASSLHAQDARSSPLDSVTAEIGDATIAIQYGRPSMRDRTIYGGLVPWNQVWRTGANEATHFRTSVDLKIGDAEIPAGHYTLQTIPREDGWTLIVNKQTGQWGTEYHEDQDLVRIPMSVETLEEPVETLTMRITVSEGWGTLQLDWERTRASVVIEVAGA